MTVGVLSVAAALLWLLWLPHFRPSLEPGEEYGIDVSHHQGRIDWQRVRDDGISFAYIKATEGGDWVDPRFETNWKEAGDAGLRRGTYHFFTLCRAGEAQANHFLGVLPGDEAALPPAVDLELKGNCSARPSQIAVRNELDRFVQLVEAELDRILILYVGDDFEDAYPTKGRLGRPLWQLSFLRRPADDWAVWQVMGYAHVAGIDGDVDLNVMRAGIAA